MLRRTTAVDRVGTVLFAGPRRAPSGFGASPTGVAVHHVLVGHVLDKHDPLDFVMRHEEHGQPQKKASNRASSARASSSSPFSLQTDSRVCPRRCNQSCPPRSGRPEPGKCPAVPVHLGRRSLSLSFRPGVFAFVTALSPVCPGNCASSSTYRAPPLQPEARFLLVPPHRALLELDLSRDPRGPTASPRTLTT